MIAPLGHLTERWRKHALQGDEIAPNYYEAEAYLADKQREIMEKLLALQESIGKVEGSLCLDEKGHLYLPPLEKEIPAEVERMRSRVYGMLPPVKLPDLLLELDNWTGFLRPFTHLTSGDAPVGEEKLILVAH